MEGFITYLITAAAIAIALPTLIYLLWGGILSLFESQGKDDDH